MHQVPCLTFEFGRCEVEIVLGGDFLRFDELGPQTVYVIHNVISDCLRQDIAPYGGSFSEPPKVFSVDGKPFNLGDYQAQINIRGEFYTTSKDRRRVRRHIKSSIHTAYASLIQMINEQECYEEDHPNQTLPSDVLDTLFEFVRDADITGIDLIGIHVSAAA